jgi:hypothetical protein
MLSNLEEKIVNHVILLAVVKLKKLDMFTGTYYISKT